MQSNKIKQYDPVYIILVRISLLLFILFTGWLMYDHFINRPPEIRHYISGNNAFKDKNYDVALDHYIKAFNYNNEDVYVIEGIARSYMQLKDFKNSETYFNLAIKVDPNFAPSYANFGVLYDRVKDYINAIYFYEKALKLDNELAKGMHWIDRLLYDVRETPSTIADRLDYLKLQMMLPEDKRLMTVTDIDENQITIEK